MNKLVTFLQDDRWPEWARVSHPTAWLVPILLLAALLRIYGINNMSPPGLEHDEVANWLIGRAILDGHLAIYFQEAYGHEAGFHYLQAAFVGLLGNHALALRLPAAFSGLLLVAVHYALTRRLFGSSTALLSAALLAILFWPIFYSRLGLRAISLPLISGLSLYGWWKAWPGLNKQSNPYSNRWFALSGLLAGVTLYTYMAGRAVPIFYALFVVYLILFQRDLFTKYWRGIALFWLLLIAVALPLVIYLGANPGAEFRISEVDAPLRALMAGDLRPVMSNALKILGMFGISGDPLWRQNVAGRPVFDPILAFFFYTGLLLALLRFTKARYVYLLLWLATSAIPSLVTTDAPSSIRMINALLVITIFPVLVINIIARLSTLSPQLSTRIAYLLGLALIIAHIWWTSKAVFHRWPQNEEVQFVWQKALTDVARYLDQSPDTGPASIGGWSPATMDPPTMQLTMRRDDLPLRYFGSDSQTESISTIIVPAWGGVMAGEVSLPNEHARLFHPAIRDLSPGLTEQLSQWSGGPIAHDSFVLYELESPPVDLDTATTNERFDEQMQLVQYRLPEDIAECSRNGCRILTYWQVLTEVDEPRRFFLHAVDGAGDLIVQHDALDAPAQLWREGDLLVQEHRLPPFDRSAVELRLGIYNPHTGRRLLLSDGRDYLALK
jgi:4-amino-4-deoxy-L-arabinose transferase-like glycosyltransferase